MEHVWVISRLGCIVLSEGVLIWGKIPVARSRIGRVLGIQLVTACSSWAMLSILFWPWTWRGSSMLFMPLPIWNAKVSHVETALDHERSWIVGNQHLNPSMEMDEIFFFLILFPMSQQGKGSFRLLLHTCSFWCHMVSYILLRPLNSLHRYDECVARPSAALQLCRSVETFAGSWMFLMLLLTLEHFAAFDFRCLVLSRLLVLLNSVLWTGSHRQPETLPRVSRSPKHDPNKIRKAKLTKQDKQGGSEKIRSCRRVLRSWSSCAVGCWRHSKFVASVSAKGKTWETGEVFSWKLG